MKRFIEGEDRSQVALLPDCLDDYIAEDNPVRIVHAYHRQYRRHRWVAMADANAGATTPGVP
jgi:hypothetical protein